MPRILIIEDEPTTLVLIRRSLQNQGHRILSATDGAEGLRLAINEKPDAIVLDVNLPNLSGFEISETLRKADYGGGILMLTARHSIDDRIAGLTRGADDYMSKPFDIREFQARITALLRRHGRTQDTPTALRLGGTEVDLENKVATRKGKELPLTKTEWSLLTLLIHHAGKPVSRDKMLDVVWGYDHSPSARAIDTHMWRLRHKLSDDQQSESVIENVHGEGYRLVTQEK